MNHSSHHQVLNPIMPCLLFGRPGRSAARACHRLCHVCFAATMLLPGGRLLLAGYSTREEREAHMPCHVHNAEAERYVCR